MVRQTTKVILLEILGVISLLLMTGVGVLAFLLANGPVSLEFVKGDVEAALTDARDGRGVVIDALSLQWMPSERRIVIVAGDLTFNDESAQPAGYAQSAILTLDAGAALSGRVELLRAELADGWLGISQSQQGAWTIAGDPLPTVQSTTLPETPEAWLERINQFLQDTLDSAARLDSTLSLEYTAFERFAIKYRPYNGAEITLLADANGRLERGTSGLTIAWNGQSEAAFLPETIGFELAINPDYSELTSQLGLGVLPLGDLLNFAGFAATLGGNMQVDTRLSATVSADQGLTAVNLALSHDSGVLRLPQFDDEVRQFEAEIAYSPPSDTLRIERLGLTSARVQTELSGEVQKVLADSEARELRLSLADIRLDYTPYFERQIAFEDVFVDVVVARDLQSFDINELKAFADQLEFTIWGQIDLDVQAEAGQVPLRADLTAELTGDAKKADVLTFWPVNLGRGGRQFVIDRIEDVTLTQARAELMLKPDSFADGYLRDDDLRVIFSYQDGRVRFLSDFPAVENAFGNGKLGGNSFSINAVESTFSEWDLQLVEVDFPQFNPRGHDFTVSAIGGGPAQSILRSLSESRLQLEARTGFDPERLTGEGRATFQMRRPALSDVPMSDIDISVKGQISQGGLTRVLGDLNLENAKADVDVTADRIIVTGFGDLGDTPVQFTWRDAFQDDEQFARLSASSIITPDFLNAFGITGRAFLTGEIPVEVQGQIAAGGVQEADIALDLKEARIDLTEIGWVKPAGEIARASLQYSGRNESRTSSLKLVSDRASLDGDIRLSPTGQLQALDLRRFYVENMMDVTGSITRDAAQSLVANIQGPFLNISSFISQMGILGAATSTNEEMLPLTLSAKVDKLRLRRDLELNGAELDIVSSNNGLELFSAKGGIARGGNIDVRLSPTRPGGPLNMDFKSSDAGFIAGAFFGLDMISGGRMQIEGVLANGAEPTRLMVRFFDTRLRDAPFITQILSLASLRGLTDTLSGEGLLFTRVEAPIRIGGGRYIIDGARASGPALGLTANGWIGTDGKGIELDGVLVPSFGVNSMLGGVPIIGDLLVGRDGEGIFSITYSVRGSLEKAQVAVNPLSAVTPGILRRIFENPSDTSIPAQLPVAPGRLPPSAKLPDLPDEEILAPLPDSPSDAIQP